MGAFDWNMGFLTTEEFLGRYIQGQRHFENLTISGGGSMSLAGKTLPQLDLRSVHLSEVDLTEANLDGAVFVEVTVAGARLQRASLRNAGLREANWQDRDVSGTDLRGANLVHAQFQRANLQGVNLQGANLTAANLRGANLVGADLRRATLGTAVFDEVIADATTQWPDDRALRRVQLAPSMTIARLTNRVNVPEEDVEEEQLPIPGQGKLFLVSQIQKAILKDWQSRPEQARFRQQVVKIFKGRCAISGSMEFCYEQIFIASLIWGVCLLIRIMGWCIWTRSFSVQSTNSGTEFLSLSPLTCCLPMCVITKGVGMRTSVGARTIIKICLMAESCLPQTNEGKHLLCCSSRELSSASIKNV